jgi:hypothetical protein
MNIERIRGLIELYTEVADGKYPGNSSPIVLRDINRIIESIVLAIIKEIEIV